MPASARAVRRIITIATAITIKMEAASNHIKKNVQDNQSSETRIKRVKSLG